MDVVTLKAIAGEFDVATFSLTLDNFPLYKEGEQAGDYRTLIWGLPRNEVAYGFNQTYAADPVLRDIFRDLRFRQAMSLAINRAEINTVVALGRAIPRQATGPIKPEGLFTEDWMGEHYAEYDPDKANALLDEMGLKWDAEREVRLRPDGQPLELLMEFFRTEGAKARIYQLTADYWGAVGVKVVLKEIAGSLWGQRVAANEIQVYNFHFDNRGPFGMVWREAPHYKTGIGRLWEDWYRTQGAQGEEPSEEVKEVFSLTRSAHAGSARLRRIGGDRPGVADQARAGAVPDRDHRLHPAAGDRQERPHDQLYRGGRVGAGGTVAQQHASGAVVLEQLAAYA